MKRFCRTTRELYITYIAYPLEATDIPGHLSHLLVTHPCVPTLNATNEQREPPQRLLAEYNMALEQAKRDANARSLRGTWYRLVRGICDELYVCTEQFHIRGTFSAHGRTHRHRSIPERSFHMRELSCQSVKVDSSADRGPDTPDSPRQNVSLSLLTASGSGVLQPACPFLAGGTRSKAHQRQW